MEGMGNLGGRCCAGSAGRFRLVVLLAAALACSSSRPTHRQLDAATTPDGIMFFLDVREDLNRASIYVCGNGVQDIGEQCDDGNTRAGDGCSLYCQVERGWACPMFGQPCVRTCGNGLQDPGEYCDDGNTLNDDGCSEYCYVDADWVCPELGRPCVYLYACGNGLRAPGEACDDGNTVGGDGCAADCKQVEPGWNCRVPGRPCTQDCGMDAGDCADGGTASGCGNGIIEPGEECDDGDDPSKSPHNGDGTYGGCNSDCTYGAYCGDGIVNGPEVCDDGPADVDLYGAPGCTFMCTQAHYCGDGVVDYSEECDYGTGNGGVDCNCSRDCRIPPCPVF
jgi:cysteine-rich repeat protein